jgi:hypothetical protein
MSAATGEYDGNPVVDRAERALRAFGRLTRELAADLHAMWAGYPELSPVDRAEMLARFPDDAPVPDVAQLLTAAGRLSLDDLSQLQAGIRALVSRAGLDACRELARQVEDGQR